ncbi:FAD-dependent oxidoreductase [Burkholderia ubonensis]|uniref:FAD-dependent oxidoreductase n=1 Tax=Burkholderia ubonensis TaxID=101571 RepID=UPI0007591BEE|nr:FAD-dependent oxidoreductase [Burkholderia ubonensis]KVS39947.1 tryptophan 2-monooxygenase oxidoreductase [Burkholderia ubonensis]KVS48043.1 tryptophan 2-monooxygenase oxidoreductase [Burkholderia ubonensis]KVS78776.1 tryptophan 2-monooxygenase oxidoreductase [Burkholderia ubonensis]KVS93423.1 tryptophan 2-monooxygenase oxidoreductase [Burkholderia ubonensis]KVS94168.1 tryptophan 2-monooxygenase oxidoreductase [Burkholderia ubonensis]
MGMTVMPRLTNLQKDLKIVTTVGEARENSRNYRHPDSALVAYPIAAANSLGTLPANRSYDIAIVGGGAAGVAALYELGRLAAGLTEGEEIHVTLYESDPNSFLHHAPTTRDITVQGLKAGRVSAALVHTGDPNDPANGDTLYEVGAMRFPEIAGMTWHYASIVFGDSAPIKVFPNPGKVPTEFVFGDRIDRYVGSSADDWMDPRSPTLLVFLEVATALVGSAIGENVSHYPIGGKDPAKIVQLLNAENPDSEDLAQIQEDDWPAFIQAHDSTTLEAAVRHIVESAVKEGRLSWIDDLDEQESVNYYVELFGRFGFGTGGFKPLFNISLVEMMRLILWDYSNEYTLPVQENVQFIRRLYQEALKAGNDKLKVTAVRERVSNALHAGEAARARVLSYTIEDQVSPRDFDFVILAAPQDQVIPIVGRSGYAYSPAAVLGDGGLGLPVHENINVYPPLLLSKTSAAANARIVTAISQLHMVRSSKVFATIETSKLEQPWVPRWKDEPIKAVVSDSGLAASYVVPSPTQSGTSPYSSMLASYTWDDDSTRLQRDFGNYPQNPATETGTADAMYRTMINRAYRHVRNPDDTSGTWWFSRLLGEARITDRFVFDWTTNPTAGGFKLDMTGDHHQSNLCFRYHTHALDPTLGNRFFLASDSYSHLGGWLEGAFMSALNSVAGLIVAANNGNANALTETARPLVTGLRPVTSVPRRGPDDRR